MTTVWFVTPAWRRYDLSAVCFDQRVRVIEALAAQGVEAHCVVVADDENLDLARARGFHVVEQDNEWLGRKFNDGMEYAGKQRADWIVPIGSDSWIDPAYFLPLPSPLETRTSPNYCAVTGDRLAELSVGRAKGAGPYMFHRTLLARRNFRPSRDKLTRGIDSSTVQGLAASLRWRRRILHPYQYIGFRGTPHITAYQRLVELWGVREHTDPWAILERHYPGDLVARARAVMT